MSDPGSVRRFFSKREPRGKHHGQHDRRSSSADPPRPSDASAASTPVDFYDLFGKSLKRANLLESQHVTIIRKRLIDDKGVLVSDAQILWALRSKFSRGNVLEATSLLLALVDARAGLVYPYDPRIKLLGAENRQAVTCYLDSTLFAMFSRLDSFEAMLYNVAEDKATTKLGLVLRLWVNLLRSGKLITTDITEVIVTALADAGWRDAANVHQQDASEAFTFITGKLKLPMLTLKMDIYHTGKEDVQDDHKYVNERLLEVAIPSRPNGERHTTTLEECLEEYFNNRIEVRRYLDRRPTIDSMRSAEKQAGVHVECVELDSDSAPTTPLSASPSGVSAVRPANRFRTHSIVQERYVPDRRDSKTTSPVENNIKGPVERLRRGSVRKEIMMPAWQFFSLIPWYTDHRPSTDEQVAAHFSSVRPILGLCLKRYSVDAQGKAQRVNTYIDIPIEIGLPHFIQDDHVNDDHAPIFGNFKLSLQSVVCHRGNSVDSGHYIAFSRATNSSVAADNAQQWMRFDDLATHRITVIDIERALKEEMPYLLFYQIVPIAGHPGHVTAGENVPSSAHDSGISGISRTPPELSNPDDDEASSARPSFETTASTDPHNPSPAPEVRRTGVPGVHLSGSGTELLPPRVDYHAGANFSSDSSAAKERSLLSRRASKSAEGLSRTFSKLTKKRNDDAVPTTETQAAEATVNPKVALAPPVGPAGSRPSTDMAHKGHRREKSKSRLSKTASGRVGTDKPDRECTVM